MFENYTYISYMSELYQTYKKVIIADFKPLMEKILKELNELE